MQQVTPSAVVLTTGLGTRHPRRLEADRSVIETIARRCVGVAPADLKDLMQCVSIGLADWAIRPTNVGRYHRESFTTSRRLLDVLLEPEYQVTCPEPKVSVSVGALFGGPVISCVMECFRFPFPAGVV
jgi:hypothetical protein